MAQLREKSYQLPKIDFTSRKMDGFDAHQEKIEELQATSDAIELDNGVVDLTGALISFGVADGSAIYLVVKNIPLILQHVDYLDGYRVQYALIRGLRRADILLELDRRKSLAKLLGGK